MLAQKTEIVRRCPESRRETVDTFIDFHKQFSLYIVAIRFFKFQAPAPDSRFFYTDSADQTTDELGGLARHAPVCIQLHNAMKCIPLKQTNLG